MLAMRFYPYRITLKNVRFTGVAWYSGPVMYEPRPMVQSKCRSPHCMAPRFHEHACQLIYPH